MLHYSFLMPACINMGLSTLSGVVFMCLSVCGHILSVLCASLLLFCSLPLINCRPKLVHNPSLHMPLGMFYIVSLHLTGAFIGGTATSETEEVIV